MKKLLIFFLLLLSLSITPLQDIYALNQPTRNKMSDESKKAARQTFSDAKASDIIGNTIEVFLSLLGIIFIILLLIAGYQYMTAQGDTTKAGNAFKSIKTAVIGLIIILMAYTITYFVFSSLEDINQPSYDYTYP